MNVGNPRLSRAALLSLGLLLGAAGCERAQQTASAPATTADRSARAAAPAEPSSGPTVVEVVARGLTFEAPDRIPAGWVTFRFVNESAMVHFAVLERLPPGYTIDDQQNQIAPVFQKGMDLLHAGDAEAANAAFAELPEWFGGIVFQGGPGLLSAGERTEATVFVEPGTYLLECYVKTDGVFHSYSAVSNAFGMVHQIEVTADGNDAQPPAATIEVDVSTDGGFVVRGTPQAGRNVVGVRFLDQTVHENFVGHDVHVAAVPEDVSTAALVAWMNWTEPEGLETPSPVRFVGGTNEMPAGSTTYFTVDLDPGRYVWVAEVPNAEAKGMLRYFTVNGP